MAGSERSGPLAASAALFDGRPWAVTPHADVRPRGRGAGRGAGRGQCGAVPVRLDPGEHDRAVARTSHLPHLAAVLVAGRLAEAPPEHLALSGPGRPRRHPGRGQRPGAVAADPRRQRAAVARRCWGRCASELDALIGGRRRPSTAALLGRPRRAAWPAPPAIPGKHGGPVRPTRSVFVSVPDHPGELARLFARRGRDRRQHRGRAHRPRPGPPGRPGRAASSRRAAPSTCWRALESRGWTTHR